MVDIHPGVMVQNRPEFQKRPRISEMMGRYLDNTPMFRPNLYQYFKINVDYDRDGYCVTPSYSMIELMEETNRVAPNPFSAITHSCRPAYLLQPITRMECII